MKLPKNWGMFLLGVWLILMGLITGFFEFHLKFPHDSDVASLLAIAAGVLLLLGR
jgi:hypothetical protein